ncbi:hypothetical protein FRC10_011965 [Ceratobasidium sp. 414]|nr:hypothetical protein FRC10_011965 [Ceratobasidium sp. 414]
MTTPTPFKDWYDFRKRLSGDIQHSLEDPRALETDVIHHEDNAFERGALEELSAEVHKEQGSVSPRSENFKRVRVALKRVYNELTAFVSIQSLPYEVLVYIFATALALGKCKFFPSSNRRITSCRITKTILAVTHVCIDWRRFAINTPTLWTHLDIIDTGCALGLGEMEAMWLERAGSAPLSVKVAIPHNVHKNYTEGALAQLVLRLGSIYSLGLHANSHRTLQAALTYWMSNGTPGSVQELFLTGRSRLQRVNTVEFVDNLPLEVDVLDSFLVPIRILRLKYVSMSFVSRVYCDLAYLELSSIPSEACLTICMLTRLLSESPGLRVLRLENLQMDSSQDIPHVEFKLNGLERLDLVKLSPDPCSTLLPMLNPGPGELSLRLEAPVDSTNVEAVLAFLGRSNVTKLYTVTYRDWFQAAACFATITDLRMLAIDFVFSSVHNCNTFFEALLPLPDPPTSSTCRWPNLRALWLIDGKPGVNNIKEVVEAYRIQTMIVSLPSDQSRWPAGAELQPLVQNMIVEAGAPILSLADWDTRYPRPTAPTLFNFKDWYDSRKNLDKAIQCYFKHSQALETAVVHREDHTFERGALGELFAEVHKEQASINPRSDTLKRASIALNRVFNQSTAFVPIRSLPHDVLVYIFALTWDQCGFFPSSERPMTKCQITETMLALTCVCTDWRRLVINTPTLWTHLDIIDIGYQGLGKGETMWLERAGSAPLSVQVVIEYGGYSEYTSEAFTQLVPHLGSVRSLGLHANSPQKLQAALTHWMSNGTPGSVQELFLTGRSEKLLRHNGPNFVTPLSFEVGVLNSFLAPIRILRLKHVSMSFLGGVYHNLVHLELSSIPPEGCPTMSMLTILLSENPGLRVLKLEKLQLDFSSGDTPCAGLELNALERLDLAELSPDPCLTLLPILNPGLGELSLRLDVPVNHKNAQAVRAFLSRSNVTKLYTKLPPGWFTGAGCFAAITDLRMLAIDFKGDRSISECQNFLKALLPLPDPSANSTCHWPNLRTLWLIEGAFETDVITEIIEAYHVRTVILSLFGCASFDWGTRQKLEPLVWNLIMENVLPNAVVAEWAARC